MSEGKMIYDWCGNCRRNEMGNPRYNSNYCLRCIRLTLADNGTKITQPISYHKAETEKK